MDYRQQNKKNLLQKLEQFDAEHSTSSKNADLEPGEHHYDSYFQYILSMIGLAVGFGSFWRFPYLVYKNGGGAFLIPYLLAMVILGMPLLYLQTLCGQMHQVSAPLIFGRINKGYKMLGISLLLICYNLAGYYNIIMAYSYRFIFSAFTSPMPFADESPFQTDYFKQQILGSSSSIYQFGDVHPGLFLLYTFSLFMTYYIVKRGVKSSGKIIIITATLPYLLFLVLALRGMYLDGALDGLRYLFIPDFSKLLALQIWIDAIVQVFYQTSVGIGAILSLSSLKPKKQKHLRGIYIIAVSIIICGLLCAVNIFMYLGHFCKEQSISIQSLTLSGPELSFNIFPKALAILPLPNFWVFFFFLAMVLLGIDTMFAFIESWFCYFKDEVKYSQNGMIRLLGRDFNPEHVKLGFILLIMLYSPFMTSSAGIHYLQFFDSFVSTIPISLGAVINYIFFVHVIPFQQLQAQSRKHCDQQAPAWIRYLLQGRIVIIILLLNLGLGCINQLFYFFKYSFGYYLFGWFITAYPYVLAYLYYVRNREQTTCRSFAQLRDTRGSQL